MKDDYRDDVYVYDVICPSAYWEQFMNEPKESSTILTRKGGHCEKRTIKKS